MQPLSSSASFDFHKLLTHNFSANGYEHFKSLLALSYELKNHYQKATAGPSVEVHICNHSTWEAEQLMEVGDQPGLYREFQTAQWDSTSENRGKVGGTEILPSQSMYFQEYDIRKACDFTIFWHNREKAKRLEEGSLQVHGDISLRQNSRTHTSNKSSRKYSSLHPQYRSLSLSKHLGAI